MYISINGKVMETAEATVSPLGEGFLYGYGAFETLKFTEDKIYFIEEHYDRLKQGCRDLLIPLEYSLNQIEGYCRELINNTTIKTGALKIVYAKNSQHNDLIISVRENKYKREDYEKGFSLCFTAVRRNPSSPLTYIKSNNYMENILTRQQAIDKGYDEVIFENYNGKLCEGTISNLFFVKGNQLLTPAVSCGILPGIMRSKIIEMSRSLGINIEIGEYTREDLLEADEIFLSNSLFEVMPVSQLEYKKFEMNKNIITKAFTQQMKI